MIAALAVAHSLIAVLLVVLVLLHSGRDAGLSGAFGVGGSGSSYGGSSAIVEKNLDRITVGVAIVFFITTYLLVKNI
jgi:preprotein translocase subunit SecG